MAYVRRKHIGRGDYYYLVETYRDQGKVRARTLAYLGKTPEVPARLAHLVGRPRRRAVARGNVSRQPQRLLWNPAVLGAAIARAVQQGPIGKASGAGF